MRALCHCPVLAVALGALASGCFVEVHLRERCDETAPCASGQYCAYEEGDTCGRDGALGWCRDRPDACPAIYGPVCGCDGRTYGNACEAHAAATNVEHGGECAQGLCGGLVGYVCPAAQWCDYPEGSACGAADQTGVCRDRPVACIEIYAPVCGCDGVTHGNECLAAADGTDVAYSGRCSS